MKSIFILIILTLIFCSQIAYSCGLNAQSFENSQPFENGVCYCKQGYYGTQEDADNGQCKECPSNSITLSSKSIGGLEKCAFCKLGYYGTHKGNDNVECTKCPDNSSSIKSDNIGGLEKCAYCESGFYVKTGSSIGKAAQCSLCPENTTNITISSKDDGLNACKFCKQGYYLDVQDNQDSFSKCVKCPGLTTNNIDHNDQDIKSCNYCIAGAYGIYKQGVLTCIMCPINSRTPDMFGQSLTSCICDDPNSTLSEFDHKCRCISGYTGEASKEKPCIQSQQQIQTDDNTQGNLLIISFSLILFVFYI